MRKKTYMAGKDYRLEFWGWSDNPGLSEIRISKRILGTNESHAWKCVAWIDRKQTLQKIGMLILKELKDSE